MEAGNRKLELKTESQKEAAHDVVRRLQTSGFSLNIFLVAKPQVEPQV